MKRFKKTQGMQVVTRREGAIVGKFDDFQFDLETGRIYGYRLRAPGVFPKTGGIEAGALLLLGRDLVLIEAEASVEWTGDKRNAEDGRAWASRYLESRAMTRRGTQIGRVEDFVICEQPPGVTALILDGARIVRLDDRIAIGKDALILDDPTAAAPLPPEADRADPKDWWGRVRDAFARDERPERPERPQGQPGPDEE